MFRTELRERAFTKLKKQNFKKVGVQHNGMLFVHLSTDRMLHRAVVNMQGSIRKYVPRKATAEELQLYGLT